MLALEHVSDVMAKSLAFVPETVAAPAPKVKVLEPALEIAKTIPSCSVFLRWCWLW
jgi:hypothetical protein